MVPNEAHQYVGMILLFQHFGWTWVGLFAGDDENGNRFLEVLEQLLHHHKMCSAFTQRIPNQIDMSAFKELLSVIFNSRLNLMHTRASVFIIYGEALTLMWLAAFMNIVENEYIQNKLGGRVWVTTAQVHFAITSVTRHWHFEIFQGTISFTVHANQPPGFREYIQNLNPDQTQSDGFLKDFWEQAFDCYFPNPSLPKEDNNICTWQEKLDHLPWLIFETDMTGHSYSVYNAVYVVAHALHALGSSRSSHRTTKKGKLQQELQPWQLHRFLQGVSFNNTAGEKLSFNGGREIIAGFDITNIFIFANNSFLKRNIGKVMANDSSFEGTEFVIHEDKMLWHRRFNQVAPLSLCSDPCLPGSHKRKKEGEKFCCYNCSPCPGGKISNGKDMDDCTTCPEDQYPSKSKSGCIPKTVTFFSHKEPLGISLALVAVSLSVLTAFVLGTFVKHKDSPIVKANNRKLTYVLLLTLLLCFLSSLLFVKKPGKVACLLRQVAFGIIFSVTLSCVLAKTITVVMAFMAIKPGSRMRKWTGKRVATIIVLSCSLLQVGICALWLGTSPPFPELDMHSVAEEILLQCNEGSITMFCLVLGYIGLLSIISFLVAFLARKLPDAFNESKFITFSMLIFCSVWLSFVPSYFSTKGKYMVAVEIFSILASGAGLLCSIFSPKCYIILLRPEMNNREELMKRKRGRI
uniref:Vomeronasal type-2 receptor 26-like n=1 Tax=Pogona vitticeps TaxID=103695 RepID=A0ABM5EJ00_9SAUR